MKTRLMLLFWIIAIVLPIGWLAATWQFVDTIYQLFFETEISRVLVHTAIYGSLAFLLADLLLRGLPRRRQYVLLGLAILTVALGQEIGQLAWKGRAFGGPELFDLAVDSVGAMLGLTLFNQKAKQTVRALVSAHEFARHYPGRS